MWLSQKGHGNRVIDAIKTAKTKRYLHKNLTKNPIFVIWYSLISVNTHVMLINLTQENIWL